MLPVAHSACVEIQERLFLYSRSRKDIHASAPQPAKRVKAALTVGAHFRVSHSFQ